MRVDLGDGSGESADRIGHVAARPGGERSAHEERRDSEHHEHRRECLGVGGIPHRARRDAGRHGLLGEAHQPGEQRGRVCRVVAEHAGEVRSEHAQRGIQCRGGGEIAAGLLRQELQHAVIALLAERGLAAEVVCHERGADSGVGGDLTHGRRAEPVRGEHLGRARDDARATREVICRGILRNCTHVQHAIRMYSRCGRRKSAPPDGRRADQARASPATGMRPVRMTRSRSASKSAASS